VTDTNATALIVEDEPLARRRLRDLIGGVPWLQCIGEAATGKAAIGAINELQPDLIFLDVKLPDMSGLDVLAKVRHKPAVIFTTAYDQFAVTAFELAALDYLLKPFGTDRFTRAMNRARPLLEQQAGAAAGVRAREAMASGPVPRLFVRDGGRIVPIKLSLVEHLEACDDYVIVHAGTRQYRLNLTLAELETRLSEGTFVRVHRSHMVNLDHVASWTPYDGSRVQIALRSGATIISSRQRSRDLRTLSR
jgi:two-component system, LytTR family, response regulator